MATFEGECCDMKDFSMKKKADYIKKCERNADGSLTVTYADGTVYDDYANTAENIEKIDAAMEKQVELGYANIGKFKGLLGLSCLVSLASSIAPAYIYQAEFVPEEQKSFVAGGAIIVSLLGAREIIRNASCLNEVDKFKKRDSMQQELSKIAAEYPHTYPHAFEGLSKKENAKAHTLIRKGEDPFTARNSDWYSERTLEKIKRNVERDKAYQLTLLPRKNK